MMNIGFRYAYNYLGWNNVSVTASSSVLLVYFISRYGDILAFTFYRAWLYNMLLSEKALTIFAALSSYRRTILLFTPDRKSVV